MVSVIPNYNVEHVNEVVIWWFCKDFSQSSINFLGKSKPSNACTIIAVLTACRIHTDNVRVTRIERLQITDEIISSFGESILFGNELHSINRASGLLKSDNLTVPEAIMSVSENFSNVVEWRTDIYRKRMSRYLYRDVRKYFVDWCDSPLSKDHPDFYIILIADVRTVLFVFQDGKISLLDSHQHGSQGAIIAECPGIKIKDLCAWFSAMTKSIYHADPKCYELTGLYFRKTDFGDESNDSMKNNFPSASNADNTTEVLTARTNEATGPSTSRFGSENSDIEEASDIENTDPESIEMEVNSGQSASPKYEL